MVLPRHTSLQLVLLVFLQSAALSQEVQKTALPQDHPLLGTWRIDLPDNCFEEYTLGADGIKLSRSGEERNESIFELSLRPASKGFYRWADQITKGNGRPDCGGHTTPVGSFSVNFIRLHPSGEKFHLCTEENLASCFAEFYIKGRNI